jgi:hypothetical protein
MISWDFGREFTRDLKLAKDTEPSRLTIRHLASSSYAQTNKAWFELDFVWAC